MAQKSYYQKLLDPRWQKKRLEILSRDDFQCQQCGDSKATLHVHHGYYERGLDPWEYDDDTLHTLCETCHKGVQEMLDDAHKAIARIRCWEQLADLPALIELADEVWPYGLVPAQPGKSRFITK
jgi:5-methylcytosine-specific restriction endonuclease McrA